MKKIDSSEFREHFGNIVTNKIEIYSEDGVTLNDVITAEGFKGIRYRDEYVAGNWVSASGAAAPDAVAYTIGGIPYTLLSFDGGNTEERVANSFEIPHDVALDELNSSTLNLEWHIHFMPSTTSSGVVKWFFDYCYIPPNLSPISQTSLNLTHTITSNQQYFHFIKGVSIPKPPSGYHIGGIILFNLRRTPSDTSDTYSGDAILIKTALHVPINDFGSRQMYTK